MGGTVYIDGRRWVGRVCCCFFIHYQFRSLLKLCLDTSTTTIPQQHYRSRHIQSAMENPPTIPSGYADRTLRIIMVFAFIPALALLTACGFAWMVVPTIGLIPMSISLAINISALKNPKSPVRRKPVADAVVALLLLAVMAYRFVLAPSPEANTGSCCWVCWMPG
jgi:hypothetical protein